MKNNRVGIIDMGTNTFHLLIAEITEGQSAVLLDRKTPVMIGKDGISHGYITEEAKDRAIKTLESFRKQIKSFEVNAIHATATSAFRNAKNGSEITEEIREKTGIAVQIIDGNQEAELIYMGVRKAIDLSAGNSVIMDIGGGSVEFIICNQREYLWKRSFEIGAQRLLDKFFHSDPIDPDEIQQMNQFFQANLQELDTAMQQYRPHTLVGASGAFDTFSEIYVGRHNIQVDDSYTELPFDVAEFDKIHQEIISKNRGERRAIPGMIEMRIDMIVVASCLIKYVLSSFPMTDLKISSFALKEGALQKAIEDFI